VHDGVGTSVGDGRSGEEDDFMKHLLADIDLDPTGRGGSVAGSDSGSGSASPGKRKRPEAIIGDEAEVEDEYGDEGWDWEGLIGPDAGTAEGNQGGEESLDVAERVLDSGTAGVKREVPSVKIEYESPVLLQPAPGQEEKEEEVKPEAGPAKVEDDDLDDFFPFDIPLSQESFLDSPGPPLPLPKYPVLHPLVHPPRAPITTTEPRIKSTTGATTPAWQPTPWARCSVTSILDREDTESRWGWGEKVLLLTDVKTGRRYKVKLREEAGEMLVLVGKFKSELECRSSRL
jgi:hypothetical protein